MRSSGSRRALYALGAVITLSYGCAQVLDLDHDYVNKSSDGGGSAASASSGDKGVTVASSADVGSSVASGAGGGGVGGMMMSGAGGGGVGGMMMSGAGGAVGAGGAGGSIGGEIITWEAPVPAVQMGQPCAASYTYSLPNWLEFSSPTDSERTTQTAPDALCRGFQKGAPRARNAGTGWGLSIESARTNLIKNSDSWGTVATGWVQGDMNVTANQPDPAGGTTATLFLSNVLFMGATSNSSDASLVGQVASSWVRGQMGFGTYAHFRHTTSAPWQDVQSANWQRYSIARAMAVAGDIALETRDVPAGAGMIFMQSSVVAYGAQLEESGLYPSSYIPTNNIAVTRQAERLSSAQGALPMLCPGGYFKIQLKFAPNFALSAALNEMSAAEYDLLYFSGVNRLYLRKADRKMVMRIGGVEAESDPVKFEREQELTVSLDNQPIGSFSFQLSGAASGDGTYSNAPTTPVATGGLSRVYILSSDKDAAECGDLRSISFISGP